MAARAQYAEHLLGGHHRRDRDDPAAERLAQHVDVGDDALELAGERRAGAAQAGLDLVGDEQHVGRGAQLADPREVAGRRHDHAGLALDRLEQDRDRVVVDGVPDRVEVAVRDDPEARGERAEALPGPAGRSRS